MMHGHWGWRGLKFAFLGLLLALGAGYLVQQFWNGLVPELFAGKTISWGQAFSLLVLSRILVGGFGGRGRCGCGGWRNRMKENWDKMSPEEREKYEKGLGCC